MMILKCGLLRSEREVDNWNDRRSIENYLHQTNTGVLTSSTNMSCCKKRLYNFHLFDDLFRFKADYFKLCFLIANFKEVHCRQKKQ
jgi:hypothetical protein